MIYFTSDLHFHHNNILKYTTRPYATLEEMHEGIIQQWNSVVTPEDTTYHLGDFSFATASKAGTVKDILHRLNGNIVLLQGNHDSTELWERIIGMDGDTFGDYYESPSARVRFLKSPYLEVSYKREGAKEKTKLILCHYPIASWNFSNYGSIHLHGHMHGSYSADGRILDVGLDSGWELYKKLTPFSVEEILKIMAKKPALLRHGANR